MLERQGSFRGFNQLNQASPFKRQLSLRVNDLPSNLERTRSHSLEPTDLSRMPALSHIVPLKPPGKGLYFSSHANQSLITNKLFKGDVSRDNPGRIFFSIFQFFVALGSQKTDFR